MSRGLSRQQLQILGLATAVSRLRYGTPRAHTPLREVFAQQSLSRN